MSTAEAIAAAVRASRSEFADIFLRAQSHLPMDQKRHFDAVAPIGDKVAAFLAAAQHAFQHHWDSQLVDELIESDRECGALRLARVAESPGNAPLQAISNLSRGLADPEPLFRGLSNGMRWTGRVVVDARAMGSCVLVLPHVVLTAWHVVRDLFAPNGDEWQPIAEAAGRLRVEFDDYLFRRGSATVGQTPLGVGAHQNWCVDFRPCHREELNHRFPQILAELEGMWDFCLIRLKSAIGLDRRWIPIDPLVTVPRPDDVIYLFQHPQGGAQKVDSDVVLRPETAMKDAVPHLRFLHKANSAPGSSGGPCFTKDFLLCGIHQGTWNGSAAAGDVVNRSVPLGRICDYLKTQMHWPPELESHESPSWSLGANAGFAPVIGCDPFQTDLWSAALSGRKPLLVISGSKGSGKTFRTQVCGLLLKEANHLKVNLNAPQTATKDAHGFAASLCDAAGSPLPTLLTPVEANTTVSAWLKDELLRNVMTSLKTARQGNRLVWIILTDLNRCNTFGEQTSEFLYLLYQQVLTHDWLRIVLDDMQGSIPESLKPSMLRHQVAPIQRAEIQHYLQRRLAELQIPFGELDLHAQVNRLYRKYQEANAEEAVPLLAAEAGQVVTDYLEYV